VASTPIAALIWSSVTVTMSSTNFRTCANVSSDGVERRPSAIVLARSSVDQFGLIPVRKPSAVSPASSGSTPMTFALGALALMAVAMPEIRPAPLTGTSTTSTSGRSAAISRPMVP
jgi:hypothetical protein